MEQKPKNALVIGGGAAGLTAALELARCGVHVDLVEKSPFLGGYGIQYGCKASPDCVICGACAVEKQLLEVVENDNITVHLNASLAKVEKNGAFSVTLTKKPAAVSADAADKYRDTFRTLLEQGLVERGYSRNNLPLFAVAEDKKDALADWIKANPDKCPADCIDLSAAETTETVTAGALILATGFTPYDATAKRTLGYGVWPNVTTGLEVERARRFAGDVFRPSDGKVPEKLAFIQCVGSRDKNIGNLWCSQVCCAYALRISEGVKQKHPDTEITVFYMDIQSVGKGFPAFYEKAKNDLRFVRNIPVDVYPAEGDNLRISFMDEEGARQDEIFDMLVLSVGITPGADNQALSELLGVSTDEDGFLASATPENKAITESEGVFIAGTAAGPKSIAASMAHAGEAACEAAKYLGVTK